jgi:hypothetical protein
MPTVTEIARHWGTSQPYASKCKKLGCPTHSLKAADNWRAANASRQSKGAAKEPEVAKTKGRPMKPLEPSDTGDPMQDTINDMHAAAKSAFRAYQRAVTGNLSTQSARLSEHSRAQVAKVAVEKSCREELERRGLLVPKHEIVEKCRRCMETVIRRLKKLPTESGPQCNEQEPLKAVTILQRAVNEIMAAGKQALSDL